MSLFDSIANDIGHTVESLAATVGADVGALESVVNDLAGNGVDVFTTASRMGLSVTGLLSGIVSLMGKDPHYLLLERLTRPVKKLDGSLSQLSQHWTQVANLHQTTAESIDAHMQELFQNSDSFSYTGSAADTLKETHQDYHKHFTDLVEHAQTQQTRHATLQGYTSHYLSQMPGRVNSLSAPMAALAVLGFQSASAFLSAPAEVIDPEFIKQVEEIAQNAWNNSEDVLPGPEDPIWDFLVLCAAVLFLFAGIMLLINWLWDGISQFFNGQKSTTPPKPKPKPKPNSGQPKNTLTPAQEKLADKLYNDYKGTGLSLDDIRAIIAANPNLSEAQLRKLLDRYRDVITKHPNLVKKDGALAVFQQFVALSAYDPAHGGDYAIKKPSVEGELEKGMEEAVVELGAMEMGLIDGPMTPSDSPKFEATDAHNQKWDVKSPKSTNPLGQPTFNAAKEASRMQKDFDNGEKIIIDDSNITPAQRKELLDQLKANGNDDKVIWWPFAP